MEVVCGVRELLLVLRLLDASKTRGGKPSWASLSGLTFADIMTDMLFLFLKPPLLTCSLPWLVTSNAETYLQRMWC